MVTMVLKVIIKQYVLLLNIQKRDRLTEVATLLQINLLETDGSLFLFNDRKVHWTFMVVTCTCNVQ